MKRHPARLMVDASKCDGHGICVLRCPDLLTLDTWGFVGVDTEQVLSGRDLRRARSAVAACPEQALTLLDVHLPAGNGVRPAADSLSWNSDARRHRRVDRRASSPKQTDAP